MAATGYGILARPSVERQEEVGDMSVGQLVEWGTGEVFPLCPEPVTLGRQEDNSIVLADAQVSRHHAEITVQAGQCVLRDLGSANGTYVNGERIAEDRVLGQEDLVALGQTGFKVVLSRVSAQQDTLVDLPVAASLAPAVQPGKPWQHKNKHYSS